MRYSYMQRPSYDDGIVQDILPPRGRQLGSEGFALDAFLAASGGVQRQRRATAEVARMTRDEAKQAAIALIQKERAEQDRRWGADRDLLSCLWNVVLTEEVGEVARAALERNAPAS